MLGYTTLEELIVNKRGCKRGARVINFSKGILISKSLNMSISPLFLFIILSINDYFSSDEVKKMSYYFRLGDAKSTNFLAIRLLIGP